MSKLAEAGRRDARSTVNSQLSSGVVAQASRLRMGFETTSGANSHAQVKSELIKASTKASAIGDSHLFITIHFSKTRPSIP